jgi:hypothetical protein
MGVSVATGTKFINKFMCPRYTSVGNSVLFVQLEEKMMEASPKAQWVARGMGLDPETIQDMLFQYIVEQPFRIDDKRRVDQLKQIIDECQPDLVLWDNARKMKTGSKNDSEWADAIAYTFNELQAVYPSTHGLLDHWRKRQADKTMNDPDEMASGNAALRDAVSIWLPCEAPIDSDVVTMHHNKMRRGKKLGSFNYRVRIIDSEGMTHLEYIGAATSDIPEESCAARVLEILESNPNKAFPQPEIAAQLAGLFSIDQVKYAAKHLWGQKLIDLQPSKGRQPTLLKLRTPLSVDQSWIEPGTTEDNRVNIVPGYNRLPDGDLDD